MKNVSKVVALILSASAGVWMTGCAAEMSDPGEETDFALANVEQGGVSKGKGLAPMDIPAPSKVDKGMMGGQGGQFGGISGEIESPILGKGNLGKGLGKGFEQQLGKGLGKGFEQQLGKGLGKGIEQGIDQGIDQGARIPAPVGGMQENIEQPAIDQNLAIDQSAGEEKVEETQDLGAEGQLDDQADVDQDDLFEGETGESQDALSSNPWYGGRYWRGRHFRRHRYYGGGYYGYPYYGGGYYGYPYYGGYPYYRHHHRGRYYGGHRGRYWW
ncbi:hypothetical protein [Polyangium spumosum]|uniref:Uncharacterized protein n=1 Tax=Polyangium spumosum TaxID=889282 RepID=A0A6N7Q5G4_9BACT|nr:hypothetical protein [Polyangium spumosum]MRG97925.1 hypothetical protein [Polyangium spumosum]